MNASDATTVLGRVQRRDPEAASQRGICTVTTKKVVGRGEPTRAGPPLKTGVVPVTSFHV